MRSAACAVALALGLAAIAPGASDAALYLPLVGQYREPHRVIGMAFAPRSLQTYADDLAAHGEMTGQGLAIVHIPAVWSEVEFLDLARLFDLIAESGATPFIVWEPWSGMHAGVGPSRCQRDYALQHILDGRFDAYIGRFARAAGEWRGGFLLDFGHEMNIDQAAWSGACNGGPSAGPERFVRAYRYVHDRFVEQGATNVQWVWSPNFQSLPLEPWNDPERYYPGDAYVDWIGTNAFNWGASSAYTENRFRGMEEIAGPLLDRMAAAHPSKRQIVIEAGTVHGDGGDRARWIADGLAAIAKRPHVRAVIYYSYDLPRYLDGRSYDFRLDGDGAARAALAAAVRDHAYGTRLLDGRSAQRPWRPRGNGATLGVSQDSPSAADRFDAAAGKRHEVVAVFAGPWVATATVLQRMNEAHIRGRTPLLVWDPTGWPLADVAAGAYDDRISDLAGPLRSIGGRILFAWAIEPNNALAGRPWSGAALGGAAGGPETYVAAWRHARAVFAASGAGNVEWVWLPHYQDTMPAAYNATYPVWRRPSPDWNHFARYYPGDDAVDWIGTMAINEGDSASAGTYWVPVRTFLSPVLAECAGRYPTKPQLVIAASVEDDADPARKADWIADLYASLQRRPAVRAVVWHNAHNARWFVTTSEPSLAAYRLAIAAPYFGRPLP